MTQIILNVESPAVARVIKALVKSMTGVHIVPSPRKKKSGFELAKDDVKHNRIEEFESVDQLLDSHCD